MFNLNVTQGKKSIEAREVFSEVQPCWHSDDGEVRWRDPAATFAKEQYMMHLAVRKNFEEKVAYVARKVDGMTVDDQSGFLAVDCGLPSDTFNVIVLRDVAEASRMQTSIERFSARGFPFAVWYWENDADQAARLAQFGLAQTERHTAMYADLSQLQVAPLDVEGLEIRPVATASDLLQVGEVLAALFGNSNEGRQVLAYFQKLSAYPLSLFPALRYYLGTFHGKAVATGLLFIGSETIGIYDIVTHDNYRRRGIGSALFRHLLIDARTERRRFCVLQASEDGLGIYRKAGFRASGHVLTFERL